MEGRLKHKKPPGGGWWDRKCEKQPWSHGDSMAAMAGMQARDNGGLDQYVAMGMERN